jgi:hypothetical protein
MRSRDCPAPLNWVEKDLTLVTIPGVGHFVEDASETVTAPGCRRVV